MKKDFSLHARFKHADIPPPSSLKSCLELLIIMKIKSNMFWKMIYLNCDACTNRQKDIVEQWH